MSIIARHLSKIKPSATMAVSRKAAQLRAQGEDVISLGAGEPDFDTPEPIKQAAVKAIADGKTKYTAVSGTDELKQAIRDKFQRNNQLSYEADQIIVGCGGKQVIYNALSATLNPGDEVLIPAPYWVSYPDMALLTGGKPVILETTAQSGFKLTPQALEKAITPRSKWLILNSPSNPTGAVYRADELRLLAQVIRKHPHLWVLCDDIYEHIIYGDSSFATLAQVEPDLAQRILTMNGVSKAYAMTGWRIGYAGGPAEVIGAMTKIQSQSTSNPCSISQAAACAALNGSQDFMVERNRIFHQRRDLVFERINAIDGLSCPKHPPGAFYLFPSCAGILSRRTPEGKTITSDVDYATYLLDEAKVALVPGTAFGSPGHVRLSYATSTEALEKACQRIDQAHQRLS